MKILTLDHQWSKFKTKHEAVILFRFCHVGVCLHDDAKTAARVLGLTLHQMVQEGRSIPYVVTQAHQVDANIKALVAAGYRVAVCEQVLSEVPTT